MRRGRPGGFTLLEIAVALAILGVGVVSVLQIFSASLRLADRASRETAAVREARAAMDAMLARPPDLFVEDTGRDIERTTEEGFTTRMTSWVEVADQRGLGLHPTHRLYHVFVSVSWQDGRGTKSYWLESLRMAPDNEEH
ncbi:MAG TPA: type II secretion system protein [Gaiellaceae bacterium]|nr:type II secretion system protein [Gaiellaceae bacterium]